MTPALLASRAIAMLRQSGDPRVAAQSRSYFKQHETIVTHGVRSAKVREIERDLFTTVKAEWSTTEALRFCELLLQERSHESKGIGFHLLTRYQESFDKNLVDVVEGWLSTNLCDNWAAVDDLCPRVLTPLVRRFPDQIRRVRGWSGSSNLWLRRASAVTFVPMARRGERLDDAYRVAKSLLGDSEDLIQKAVGWLLREAGKTDMPRLERFLLDNGPRVSRTTVRYAIERFPERKRLALLAATRGNPA